MPFLIVGAGLLVGALLAVATAGPALQRKLPGWTSIADAVSPNKMGGLKGGGGGGDEGGDGSGEHGKKDLGSIISNFVNTPITAARAIAVSAAGYAPSPDSTAPGQPMTLLAGPPGTPAWGPSPVNIPTGGYVAPVTTSPVGNVLPFA